MIAFHVEHIVSKQHGGTDDPGALALACDRCNAYKGPNLASVDPGTGAAYPGRAFIVTRGKLPSILLSERLHAVFLYSYVIRR